MSERLEDLRGIVQAEMEAAVQEACGYVVGELAWQQEAQGWTDAEIKRVLREEDEAMMERFRTLGFATAWEDRS
jgi:hypothetical protein